MKRNRKKGSVYSLMLQNYILFTLMLAVFIISLLLLFLLRSSRTIEDASETAFEENVSFLEEGRYGEFPVARLLGERSFIMVLDTAGKQVYSGSGRNLELTKDELYYVPEYNADYSLMTYVIDRDDGGVNYSLEYMENEGDGQRIYIWDDGYRLLYSSSSEKLPPMTEKLFSILSGNYFEGYSICRYSFENSAGGGTYTLLIFMDVLDFSLLGRIGRAASDSLILLLVFYFLMILGFSWWLKRKITRPLRILQNNLNSYEIGKSFDDEYKGPREFCDIFESCRNMAGRLEESEQKHNALEMERRNMMVGAAHDLKTPITVILGYAEALRDGVIPEERRQEYQKVIVQKAQSLNELINTFYDFSKLDHPDYSAHRETADICIFLRDYIADRYVELQNGGFEPQVDIPEIHLLCSIDNMQLRRVFDNIINNSVKHNPGGTALFVRLRPENDGVHIILGDGGCGIAEDIRADVFKPFVMGDPSRQGTGSGLGLAVAQRIVEAHAGSICLLPADGELHTAFEIVLPIAGKRGRSFCHEECPLS